jgi:putative FmdB family regulatory protein
MPIFEYRCQDCGTRFEKLIRGESTEVLCPGCGKERVEKQLSTFAAHSGSASTPAPMPGGCASGMCPHPNLCGRN